MTDLARKHVRVLLDAALKSGVPVVTWGKKVTGVLLAWLEKKDSIDLLPTLLDGDDPNDKDDKGQIVDEFHAAAASAAYNSAQR